MEVISWYRNHAGEESYRRVRPIKFWYGVTKWHRQPQMLLRAHDLERDAERDFAVADIKAFVGSSHIPVSDRAAHALGFYADARRYDGPNQKPIADDPFAKPDAAYVLDVTRDGGSIAREALLELDRERETV